MKSDLPHFLNACAQLYGCNISYPPQQGDISIGYHCCWQNWLLWADFEFLGKGMLVFLVSHKFLLDCLISYPP